MRPVRYYVSRIGDHWEVSCSLRGHAPTTHPDRQAAEAAATAEALAQWKDAQVATEVVVDEEDGSWHPLASYGSLLAF